MNLCGDFLRHTHQVPLFCWIDYSPGVPTTVWASISAIKDDNAETSTDFDLLTNWKWKIYWE